jgi:arsenate reductase
MKRRVLFLCTGNSARSQMAEGFVRHCAGDALEPHSAGLEPRWVNPLAVQAMREVGIDITGHESKSVSVYLGKLHFAHAITVCANAEEQCPRLFPMVEDVQCWPFEDPAAFTGSDAERLARFREVRHQIDARVKAWLEELAETDGVDKSRRIDAPGSEG